MTPHVDQRLSAYIDQDLAAAEREEVESHLATCPDCSQTLEELRGVVTMARALEDRPPEAELWPEIEARLGAAPEGAGSPARARWTAVAGRSGLGRWQLTFSLPQLAAAGLALVLLSGGAVWIALRQSPMRAGAPGPIAAAPGETSLQRFPGARTRPASTRGNMGRCPLGQVRASLTFPAAQSNPLEFLSAMAGSRGYAGQPE